MLKKCYYIFAFFVLLLYSCTEDGLVSSKYSKYMARFSYDQVITNEPLRVALTSGGTNIFCSLYPKLDGSWEAKTPSLEPYLMPMLDRDRYKTPICIKGFIVGQSNSPDMTTGELEIMCFDLVCPTCYDKTGISRSLEVNDMGKATCSRCKLTYDLNTGLCEGNGKILERYQAVYFPQGQGEFVVRNR